MHLVHCVVARSEEEIVEEEAQEDVSNEHSCFGRSLRHMTTWVQQVKSNQRHHVQQHLLLPA